MATIKLVLSFFLSLYQIISPMAAYVMNFGESNFFTEWSVNDEFTEDCYAVVEKDPEKDFVILNLADVQMEDDRLYAEKGVETAKMIDELVEEHKPDLITLTGDNAWGTMSYIELIRQVDAYGIPWAPVMGNHDGQGCVSEFWAAYLLSEAENCLFEFGPEDMGYGNYIINVTENGKIIHTLFMMDTHNNADYTADDGSTYNGYDHLWENQIEWYKWAVNGISEIAGKTVESTVIMHIPVYEYRDAWKKFYGSEELGTLAPELAPDAQGVNGEGIFSAPVNNGFFTVCKELGSTKNMLVGHDHANDFRIVYEGIGLNYALKTGYGSYFTSELMGATTITIGSDGVATVEHNYVDALF
ncbi:MAG: metallophosphoesterase [Clostridia bacterium]|nr:metallophosphoesterase [Clostridia bacterium]